MYRSPWILLLLVCAPACSAPREPPPDVSVIPVLHRRLDCSDAEVAGAPAPVVPAAPRVVLISIDGLRPDALFDAPAPALLALACRGSYSFRARTILPSLTLPSHASMLSGVRAERHGIFHNDMAPGYIPVPTVLGAAHQAGKRVVLVVGKEKLGQLAPEASRDGFRFVPGNAEDLVTAALAEVALGFDLLFLHLPDPDTIGHLEGWMSRGYLRQVAAVDAALSRLLAALPPEVTVMVTSDHGGSRYIHGYDLAEHVYIPWIVAGPGVRVGYPLATDISTMDTAPTVAKLLGVSLLDMAIEGLSVDEALGGTPRPSPGP